MIEISTKSTRLAVDIGYPLFLHQQPIDQKIAKMPAAALLKKGVLPAVEGLYAWDGLPRFDAVLISHAHQDHYGLASYVHPKIPVYASAGTKILMELTQLFTKSEKILRPLNTFRMYQPFQIGDFTIKPYLMDHSAFDAAAFEISAEGKTILYTGDYRAHGRKNRCFDAFINQATKNAAALITEGTMLGRGKETVLTEQQLEVEIIQRIEQAPGPVLFQASSQNIDRLVSFYRASRKLGRIFVVDVFTANVLLELHQLGNRLPYPSRDFKDIRVFFPRWLTKNIFERLDKKYAKRFSPHYISRKALEWHQERIVMLVRPTMLTDLKRCGFRDGQLIYSKWQGYRNDIEQQRFERNIQKWGFSMDSLHTSGHVSVPDLKRLIGTLAPQQIIPIHTMVPEAFGSLADNVRYVNDGDVFTL